MSDLVAAVAVLAFFGVILLGLARLAARARRRGTGAPLMGLFEEIYHPAAHRACLEVQVQNERPATAPNPGDRLI